MSGWLTVLVVVAVLVLLGLALSGFNTDYSGASPARPR
jgi:hypothetical protein